MTTHPTTTHGTALVTGATSGIGRAVALQLAKDGWEVIVHGRNPERAGSVVEEILAAGGKARFLLADLSNLGELSDFARAAGDVDLLVNNAGWAWFGPTKDSAVTDYDQMFNANVRSAYFLVAALRSLHGGARRRKHHQHREHGGTGRPGEQCGLQRDEGVSRRDDPRVGGGVQSPGRSR